MSASLAITNRKRERKEAFPFVECNTDQSYNKNKRFVHDVLQGLQISDMSRTPVPTPTMEEFSSNSSYRQNCSQNNIVSSSERPMKSYEVFDIHKSCPAHDLFRQGVFNEESDSDEDEDEERFRIESDIVGQVTKSNKDYGSGNILRGKHIEKRSSIDSSDMSMTSDSDIDEPNNRRRINSSYKSSQDPLISVLKGGRPQYLRKVDYLVDELIRKTRKLKEPSFEEGSIPSFIGPSPRTDPAVLSIRVPFSTDFCSLSHNQTKHEQSFQLLNETIIGPSIVPGHKAEDSNKLQPILLSGDMTHGDWGMEEIASNADETDENDSDVAYCDDWSHPYSSCDLSVEEAGAFKKDDLVVGKQGRRCSLSAGNSMDSSSDDEISTLQRTLSPWGNASIGTNNTFNSSLKQPMSSNWTRSSSFGCAASSFHSDNEVDDDDDDVINVGTFG